MNLERSTTSKRTNIYSSVSIEEYLKTKPEVLIDYPGEDREQHRWSIASFNRRTGNKCLKFVPNRHTNEVV